MKFQTQVFCPKCKRIFQTDYPRHSLLDGAHFGPNLSTELILMHPEIILSPGWIRCGAMM